ncbi:hypothetical protein KW785_01140 [Candidatus Parcubacteria bacterium]|nr:hypothetical protein [Candidatus Parcubacteria bacterium]
MKRRLLWIAFTLIALLGLLHIVASKFYFYWDISWFDNVMHFLGGLSLGFFLLWFWFASGVFERSTPGKREAFVVSLVSVMLIGIGWEFFEFVHGLTQSTEAYSLDTFHDLSADFLGAAVAGLIGRRRSFYE